MIFYKKIGNCFKQMHEPEPALYYYKKQLQLAYSLKDTMNELDAYDNMGLAYYYMGNVNKSIFYHNRMMSGKLEEDTDVKKWNIMLLEKDRNKKNFYKAVEPKSMFREYKNCKENNSEYIFPHQNENQLLKYFLEKSYS